MNSDLSKLVAMAGEHRGMRCARTSLWGSCSAGRWCSSGRRVLFTSTAACVSISCVKLSITGVESLAVMWYSCEEGIG